MISLGQARREFTVAQANLVLYINSQGFGCALNEAMRSNEQAEINALGGGGRELLALACDKLGFKSLAAALRDNGKNNGIRRSVHMEGLAVDLNLYKGGLYLPMTEDHRQFGEWWKKQHPLARWGGDWGDGNHYSFEWLGTR